MVDLQFSKNLKTSIDFAIEKDINKINNVNINDDKEQLEELLVKNLEMLEILKENTNEIETQRKTNLKTANRIGSLDRNFVEEQTLTS